MEIIVLLRKIYRVINYSEMEPSYFFISNTYMYYGFIPYLSILRYNVDGLILSMEAVFDLTPEILHKVFEKI